MSDFTLHLGFNWDSPLIGTIWNTAPVEYRFLQYALASASGNPAWFQFEPNNTLGVMIWDLSTASPGTLPPALAMSFGPLEGSSSSAYDPNALVDLTRSPNVGISQRAVNGVSQPYLAFNHVVPGTSLDSPWGTCRASYAAGEITLSGKRRYKLSFLLRAAPSIDGRGMPPGGSAAEGPRGSIDGLDPRSFLSDPEVIVGSGE